MERKLGNIFGYSGGNYAGNVYDQNYMCPTLNTMQGGYKQPMIIKDVKSVGNLSDAKTQSRTVYDTDSISQTLCSGMDHGNTMPHICEQSIVAMRGRNPENPSDRTVGAPTEQRLGPNSQGICNTLTSVQKDNMVLENFCIGGLQEHQTPRTDGISPSLTAAMGMGGGQTPIVSDCKYRIRKLTPKECWRLMDFTDEDFLSAKTGERSIAKEMLLVHSYNSKKMMEYVEQISNMSNTQLYKQAGNSIVKNCLVAILGQMIPGKEDVYKTRCS